MNYQCAICGKAVSVSSNQLLVLTVNSSRSLQGEADGVQNVYVHFYCFRNTLLDPRMLLNPNEVE